MEDDVELLNTLKRTRDPNDEIIYNTHLKDIIKTYQKGNNSQKKKILQSVSLEDKEFLFGISSGALRKWLLQHMSADEKSHFREKISDPVIEFQSIQQSSECIQGIKETKKQRIQEDIRIPESFDTDTQLSAKEQDHDWKTGARVGEAKNPGPYQN